MPPETQPGRGVRIGAWDATVAVWVVACIALSVYTGLEIRKLNSIGDTLVVSSRALDSTATAMNRLKDVPFVGQDLGKVASQISNTADSARKYGASSRITIDRVALLLAIAIFVIAVIPPVVAYLAIRRRLTLARAAA